MSEGWADFNALLMVVRPGDNLNGTFGAGIYAPRFIGDSGYFGIRRFPYSVDMSKNPLTFTHIQNGVALPTNAPILPNGGPNAEVHNTGEVWAMTMFEVYNALHKNPAGRTFEQVRRQMADYLVAGLKLHPAEATFTEARDAMLAAIKAGGIQSDLTSAAGAFAKRGLGSCAVSPPRDTTTNIGVTESFETKAQLAVGKATVDDALGSCDHDGTLDSGEYGYVTVTVTNASPVVASDVGVTLGHPPAGMSFLKGPTARIPSIPPYGSAQAQIAVGLAPGMTGIQTLSLDVTLDNAAACAMGSASVPVPLRGNTDDVDNASATEDFESSVPVWTKAGNGAAAAWDTVADDATHHHMHGADSDFASDTSLVSPPLMVGAGPLSVAFVHSHAFEADGGGNYDAGVIEVSEDGGATWKDVTSYAGVVDPYSGVVAMGTALAGRRAFVGLNGANPGRNPVNINFGTALAGKTIQLRFRIVTDSLAGAGGWDLDDIAFTGLTNKPFRSVVANQQVDCKAPPPADTTTDPLESSGCGCTAGAALPGAPFAGLFAAVLLGLVIRRRRR
jgi:MYXO-CTERM domain-containing protein